MQTLTVQITDNNALKALHALEERRFIRIVDESDVNSPSLPGKAMPVKAFKIWINEAENKPSVNLKEAKAKWAGERKPGKGVTKQKKLTFRFQL